MMMNQDYLMKILAFAIVVGIAVIVYQVMFGDKSGFPCYCQKCQTVQDQAAYVGGYVPVGFQESERERYGVFGYFVSLAVLAGVISLVFALYNQTTKIPGFTRGQQFLEQQMRRTGL